MKKNKFI